MEQPSLETRSPAPRSRSAWDGRLPPAPQPKPQGAPHPPPSFPVSFGRWLWRALGWVLAWVMLGLGRTLRIVQASPIDPRMALRKRNQPYVYALRHGDLLLALLFNDEAQLAAMLSGSHHGELLIPLFTARRIVPIRGSKRTSRRNKGGLLAIEQLTSWVHNATPVLLTVDGPRGPLGRVSLGIVEIALRSQALIVPLTLQSSSCWRLPTWDKLQIPKPFATLTCRFAQPIDPTAFANRRAIQQAIVQAFVHLDAEQLRGDSKPLA